MHGHCILGFIVDLTICTQEQIKARIAGLDIVTQKIKGCI